MLPTEPEICVKVFICYSHADQDLRIRLEEHLSALIYSGKITIWQDQKIPLGANWEDLIDTHLGEADLILPLISASFIASKYCWNKEVRVALKRHKEGTARVVPIVLKPVDFQDTPLGQLQALPTGVKPVTRWIDQDEAFEDIVRGIRIVVEDLRVLLREQQQKREQSKRQFNPDLASEQALSAASATPPIASSPLHPTPSEVHKGIQSPSTESSLVKENSSSSSVSNVFPPSTKADQAPLTEMPTIPLTESRPTGNEVPLTPAPWSQRVRRLSNKRMLFTLVVVLLVGVSGGGLYSLWFVSLSPKEATRTAANKATATAFAQDYNAVTAKQGVMFGFDAAHTHNNPYEHTLSAANVSRLQPLWSFDIGGTDSSPAVAGGMIYVGSGDKKFYAFDATCRANCQPLWSFATGDWISSSPAVAGGMVYVGSHNGSLYAFDASCRSACQPLWSFATGDSISSSPTVAGGMVYVGSDDKKFYAFDASCRSACQPLWSFATGDSISSSPAVAGGIVYVDSADRKLYAFDGTCRKNCQPLWSFATGQIVESSPAVAGGMVYVGSHDGSLYAFDASCRSVCQPLWSFAIGGQIESSPAVAGGMVYVGSDDKKFYAFDATCRKNCQPLWSFATGGLIPSSPAVAGGIVYVSSWDSQLYAFDASCRSVCQPLWSFAIGNWVRSSPAVAGGMVYVSVDVRTLCAFGLTV